MSEAYQPFLTTSPPWVFPSISFDETVAPVEFDMLNSPLSTLNSCKNFVSYLAKYLREHGIESKQVKDARYAFDYAYRVRRGLKVDAQAVRYKDKHLEAWTLPTERDPAEPSTSPSA
ncbi:hypothetical protein CF319_g4207 [Tilletia indica]|nr:hypothetical protein CF319_g4207 [Tilletia indica]